MKSTPTRPRWHMTRTAAKTALTAALLAIRVDLRDLGGAHAFGHCGRPQSKSVPVPWGIPSSSFHGPSRFLSLASTADDSDSSAAVGPKAEGRRRSSSSRRRSSSSSASGPKSTGPRSPRPDRSARRTRPSKARSGPEPNPARQAPESQPRHQQSPSPSKSPSEPFDGKKLTASQVSNSNAPLLDLKAALSGDCGGGFRCVTPGVQSLDTPTENMDSPERPWEYRSLDDLLSFALQKQGITESEVPRVSLSEIFNSDATFRTNLRSAIRLDVFETTPFYAKLPEKAKSVLLLPDSSLEGSWRIPEVPLAQGDEEEQDDDDTSCAVRRMKHTTRVLNQALQKEEEHASTTTTSTSTPFRFTGDDLFEAIGAICGDGASTHWIDIYGVQDRTINHSWHLDAGRSPQNCKTVLWGFPPEDQYRGTGIFSHIVSLQDPFGSTLDILAGDDASAERPRMEPVLFEGSPGEEYVVRPRYEPGKELLVYRDIDVLHSAPDVAYRTSVMRFM